MKTVETLTTFSCDMCGAENIDPQGLLHRETMGYGLGQAVGVEIHIKAFGGYCEHVCEKCAEKALFNASKTLPEWQHMLRAKAIIKDLLCWYENGNREMRELDRIRDAAADLFGES